MSILQLLKLIIETVVKMSAIDILQDNIGVFFEIFKEYIREEVQVAVAKEISNSSLSNESALFTTEEAAEYLRIKPQTLRVWSSKKKIRNKKVGKRCLYEKSVLDEYLSKKTRLSSEEIKTKAITQHVIDRLKNA